MTRIECTVPLKVSLRGRLDAAALEELGETVEAAVAARLTEARRTLAARRPPERALRLEPRSLPVRERYDPQREEGREQRYGVPSYEGRGRRVRVPVTRRIALPPLPATRSFRDLWRELDQHRFAGRTAQALALAPAVVRSLRGDDALNHGGELGFWLMDQGRWPLAREALEAMETAWWIRWVLIQGPGVPRSGFAGAALGGGASSLVGPRELIDRAKQEAAAGRTTQAFRLFGLAVLFLQMQLEQYYEARTKELERLHGMPPQVAQSLSTMGRTISYLALGSLYAMMREILGYYPRLEREALIAGDPGRTRLYSTLGFALRLELQDEYLLEGQHALTMESLRTTAPGGGPGYRIFGAGGREEVVTPLPGAPAPSELGRFPSYHSTMENLLRSISGQEELLTELYRHPEIRSAFGTTPPDMNSLGDRLRVWRIMYRVYQREDIGFGSLHRLLQLMERYLKSFTRHTVYDVRDFGVSYLTRELPRDLAGRTVRDCGVYALTVAYEVFRTARGATPRLPVSFRLFAMPEHVSLVIFDESQDTHYVVNNDRIDGPKQGGRASAEVYRSLARGYSSAMGRAGAVTPVVRVELGSTRLGVGAFRSRAWSRFKLSTRWGFRPLPPSGPGDTRTEAERGAAAYRQYYQDSDRFGRGAVRLAAGLDSLSRRLLRARPGARRALLARGLPDLVRLGRALAVIFQTYGPGVGPRLATSSPSLAGRTSEFLYYAEGRPGAGFPLVRLARALLFFQAVGGRGPATGGGAASLSPDEASYLAWALGRPSLQPDITATPPGPDL